MKLFTCPHCSHRLYFENISCLNCGSAVAYDPDKVNFVLLSDRIMRCANADDGACNWVADAGGTFCRACALNKTIPDLSIEGNHGRWARVERAKKRAVYTLLAFHLPVHPKATPDDETGLAFDFLSDQPGSGPGGEHVLTGHDNGLITLNVAEADSSEREKLRVEMGERYRTLLGHFRHELGHFYWDRLIRDDPDRLAAYRDLFGDESVSYEESLQRHYQEGAPANWEENYISAYSTMHPWEDWAESWAHYLHITDTLEMTHSLNMRLGDIETVDENELKPGDKGNPVPHGDRPPFATIMERWLVLSEASNSINRCMGLPDLYPFVISPATQKKLEFIHDLLANRSADESVQPTMPAAA